MENNSFEDVPEAVRGAVLVAGAATFLTVAIHKYQDQIMEMSSQVTQPIKDVLPEEVVREAVLVAGAATFLSLAILKYQDQIMEMSSQVTQPIKDALGQTYCKILDFLGDVKEKVMSLPSAFCSAEQCTADVQDTEASTPEISTRSLADRIKDLVPNMGNTGPVSGE